MVLWFGHWVTCWWWEKVEGGDVTGFSDFRVGLEGHFGSLLVKRRGCSDLHYPTAEMTSFTRIFESSSKWFRDYRAADHRNERCKQLSDTPIYRCPSDAIAQISRESGNFNYSIHRIASHSSAKRARDSSKFWNITGMSDLFSSAPPRPWIWMTEQKLSLWWNDFGVSSLFILADWLTKIGFSLVSLQSDDIDCTWIKIRGFNRISADASNHSRLRMDKRRY